MNTRGSTQFSIKTRARLRRSSTNARGDPRQIKANEDLCFDDWCIAVERIEHGTTMSSPANHRFTFRLASRARRRPQQERNLTVYLLDAHGGRFEPITPSGDPPFDILLFPNDTVRTTREFDLPLDVTPDRLIITHQGGFPIGWFIIGEGPFSKGVQLAIRYRCRPGRELPSSSPAS